MKSYYGATAPDMLNTQQREGTHSAGVDPTQDGAPLMTGVTANLHIEAEVVAILYFIVTLVASNLITPLMTAIDFAFVGRYSADSVVQLAALGDAMPLTDYTLYFFEFTAMAMTNVVSFSVASRETPRDADGKVYGILFFSFVSSLIFAIALASSPEFFLTLLQVNDPSVLAIACQVVRARAFAMPAAIVTPAAFNILVARKDTVSPLICLLLAAVVNIGIDIWAVAFMGWGAVGASYATSVAMYVTAFAVAFVIRRKGLLRDAPWGTLPTLESLNPIASIVGPVTFLMATLAFSYTAVTLQVRLSMTSVKKLFRCVKCSLAVFSRSTVYSIVTILSCVFRCLCCRRSNRDWW